MIFGGYPCCDDSLALGIPDGAKLPMYFREACPHCGAAVWHRLSHVDPESWTEPDFLEEHEIDEATKMIRRKVTVQ